MVLSSLYPQLSSFSCSSPLFLSSEFAMTGLGQVNYILDIVVTSNFDGMFLSEKKIMSMTFLSELTCSTIIITRLWLAMNLSSMLLVLQLPNFIA